MKINYNSMLIRNHSFLQILRFSLLISLFYLLPLQSQAQAVTRFNIDVSHLNSTSLCANQALSFKLTTRIYAGDPASSCPGLEFYLKNLRYRVEIGTLDTLWFSDIKDNGNIATIYTKNGGVFTVALGDIADADNDVVNTSAGANEATIDFCKDSENLPCTCGSTTTEGPCDSTVCPKTYGITDLTFNITYTIPNTAATGTYPVTAQEVFDIYSGYASPSLVQANFCANYPASYQPARSFDVASCPVSICAGEEFTLTLPSGTLPGEWYKDNVATGNTTLTYIVTTPGTYKYQGVTASGCAFSSCADAVFIAGPCATIGNYVWNDIDGNGLSNEAASAGLNGVVVELWKENTPGSNTYSLVRNTTTANDGSGNPGYYLFNVSESANYYIHFPTTNGGNGLSAATTTAATDGNSDANASTGNSPVFAINVNGTGTAKDNLTIDAGYNSCTLSTAPALTINTIEFGPQTAPQPETVTLNGGGTLLPESNVAGFYSSSTSEGALYTLCSEISQPILPLQNPYTHELTGTANGLTTTQAFRLAQVVQAAGFNSQTGFGAGNNTITNLVALQLASWNALYDTDYTVTAGNFQSMTANNAGAVTLANTWLTAAQAIATATVVVHKLHNAVGQDLFMTGDVPPITVQVTPPVCAGVGAPNNATMTIVGFTTGQRYQYSTGTTFNSAAATPASPTTIPAGGIVASNLANTTQSYTVRVFDATNNPCFTDRVVTINAVTCVGSVGNYVWTDINGDGTQDTGEAGINGVTVELYKETSAGSGSYTLSQTTTTANNGTNDGAYNFVVTESANYYVHFPTTTSGKVVSTQTTIAATDGNSDANTSTGNSPIFAIDIYGTGTAKDNPTIDAGYKLIPIITAIAGACDANSNQYSVTGTITGIFPATGQMLVNIAGEGSILYSAPFPSSPLSYSITGLISDASSKTVTITFTDAPALNTSVNYTAPAACITNTCVSGGAGVETYSYALPLSTTDIVNQAITLPKFNDMGGTRVLEKVLITQKQSTITNGLLENTSATVDSFFLHLNTKGLLSMAGDTLLFADYDANYDNKELSGNVFVPTNGAYPAWLGDVNQPIGAGFVPSTLARMEVSSTVVTNDLPNFIDPRLNSGWVTNLTGDPTHDDDIWYISPLEMSKSASKLVTTSLASYIGTGNLNMLANADASLNFQGGGGNVVLDVRTKYTTTVTVTYYYCPAATIGNYVWNDADGDGTQDGGETGINGVNVELYKETSAGSGSYTLSQTTTTANNGTNDGAYNFVITESANYYVHFPTTANSSLVLSTQTTTAATDGNSDANTSNGNSPIFAMDVNGIGTAKDNPTIDAGYKCNVSAAISGITCSNAANGQATALGTGGLAPYTYTWNTSPIQTTASVTNFAPGSYIVTVVDANQCSDTAHLTIHSFPNSGISGPSSACALEDALFQATNPQVGNIYSWNFGSFATPATSTNSSETITFGAAAVGTSQTISLTVTTAAGCTETYSVSVNVTPSVFANAGPDATICQGASSTLGGSPSGQTGSTYLWTPNLFLNNNTVANPLSTPPSTITYTLTTTLNGCVKTDQVTVTVDVNLNPIADAGADQSICAGQSVAIGGAPTSNQPSSTYTWSPATGLSATNIANPTANPSATTTYQVIVRNTFGCPDTDEVVITVNPIPSAPTVTNGSRCGTGVVTLNASGCAGGTLSWFDASTGGTFLGTGTSYTTTSISSTTNYYVSCTQNNCASSTRSMVTATVNAMPNSGISGPSSACALEDALFQATNPQVGNIYSWNFGSFATPATSTNSSETITLGAAAVGTSQTISLTVTTAAGCTETYSVSVNVTPSVFANAGPDATICQGASSTLGGSPSGQTGSTYLWTPNLFLNNNTVANPLSTPPSTITYTLTTTLNGCVKTDQVTITVDVNLNPIADAGADQSICAGQSVTIGGSPTATPSTNVFYSWSPATGLSATNIANPTANPSTTTTYQVIVINTLGCPDTDFVVVNVTPALNVTETHTNILCKGAATGSIDLTVTGGNGTTTYSWSNGATTQDLTNVVAGNYSVTVTSGACSQLINVSITEPAIILTANITAQVNVSTTGGANGSATVTATGGTSPYTYTWTTSPVQYTATATGLTAGTYTVTVIDANGCIQTANVTIIEPATIGDFVWNDLDNDGIQDAGEPGVSGIIVTLYNNAGDPVQTTVTDAYGYYSFTTSAGTYTIGFSLPVDYGFSPKGTGTATDSDVNLATGRTDAIVLNNGDNRTDIDAGVHFISIITASLGDFVWLDSTPNGVQDGTEQGVAGVLVTLYNGTTNATIQSTITNGEGYYFFTNLTPADYYVGFALPAGYTFVTQNAGLDDVDSDVATSGANFGKTIVTTISAGENDLSWDAGIVKTAAGTASVGDFVWNDINHDGIQDANEPGIAGVTVTLKDPSGAVIATTTTDALGGYIFNGLAAGTYYITFSTPSGYTPSPTDASGEDDTDSDAGLGGNTGLFTLISNEVRTNIDAGFYQTSPAGTAQIGDFVWYDTNQNGIQDLGEAGVPGVTVTLYNAAGNPIATTVTNNVGNYIFTDLAAGTYTIGFSNLPEGYEFSPSGQGTASTGSDADSRGLTASITLSAGQINTDIDAGLMIQEGNSGKGSLGNYVWLDLDNDNVQDSNESGVANVTVNLLNGTTNAVLKSTKTDVSGYYIFTGLDAGTYKVEFTSLPTNLTLVSQNAGTDDEKDSDANASTGITATIALAQGQNRLDVDAGLRSSVGTGSIGDFVWMDTNGNGLQDIGEPGIGGIGVVLYDGSGNVLAVTTTNSEGFYVFGGLPAGTYQVGFVGVPTGLTFTTQTTGTANGSDANPSTGTSPTFTLLAGETKTDIDAGLQSTRAMIGNYVWLDDNKDGVQDATEKGVAGVTVTLYNASNTALASTITDANGFYLFPNVTPATGYTLGFATIPDGLSFTAKDAASGATADEMDSDVNTATGKTNAFSVAAGDVNLSFDAGLITPNLASLNGYVWFDLNKDGIQDLGEAATSGVTVTLYNAAGTVVIATAITDANGNYLFDNVAPGTYSVGFGTLPTDANGILYAFTSPNQGGDDAIDSDVNPATGQSLVTYTIADGEHKEAADAGLIRQVASIGDNVWLDANENGIQDGGEPGVGGITVTLYNSAGTAIASTTTSDTYGNYLFADLAPGSYTVGFSLPIDYVFTVQNTSSGTSSTDSDPNITTGRTNIITVAAGDNRTDIDAGIYFEINTPSGSLGDYVWLDGDGNGVQDGGEMGVSNVTVTLYDGTGTVLGSTVTDGDGYYHFTNVVAGNSYQVGFTLPAGYTYTLPNQGGNDLTDSDALTSGVGFGKTAVFVLNVSAYDMTIDAGLVAIDSANASVGDFVWNDLNQNGIQEVGEPGQAGIAIKLLDANGVLVATTTTDVFGKYIFTDVADGSYQIEFGLPSGYLFSPANQLTNDEADSDANTSTGRTPIFFVSSGDKLTDLDAGIYQSPATGTAGLGNYVWYDSDQNGLQDTGEPGVAGVIVTLFNSSNVAIATTTTDNLGYYTFVNLAAGNYQVQFSNLPNGRAFTTANVVGNDATDSDADATTGMSHVITLANGQYDPTIDAGIILSSGNSGNASLGDFVWNDVNNNGIQDTGEPGVSGIKVKLTNILTNAVDSTTTNATGYYIFNSLAAGQYELTFTNVPSGYNIVSANAGTDTGKDSDVNPATGKTTTLTLANGDANLTIDMGIHNPSATASLGDQVWNDKDKDGVQDVGEVGVAGLTVTLYDANGVAIRTTVTNQSGNYLFAGLVPGIYAVGFSNLPTGFQITKMDRGGDDTKDSDANALTGKTNPISLASGENNLDLDAGIYSNTRASIGNYVWYDTNINGMQDATEIGVAGVTVTLVDNLGAEVGSRITDADGFYYFSNMIPGTYSLTFTTLPSDYTFTTANTTSDANDSDVDPNTAAITGITVAAGDVNYTFDAGIIPPQLGGLTGYVWYDYKTGILGTNNNGVQDNGEKPVNGVTVELYDNSGNLLSTTVTAPNGIYYFDNLVPANYEIRFVKPIGTQYAPADQGSNNSLDSDVANILTGSGGTYTVIAGQRIEAADAGLVPPANITGFVFKDGCANQANTANGVYDTNGGLCNDTPIPGVWVLLIDEATNTVLRRTQTTDPGIYIFRNVEVGRDYKVAFEPTPQYCATCDFTEYNFATAANDTTDSDVNINELVQDGAKLFAKSDLITGLQPLETRPDIDAGYRLPGSTFPVELLYFNAELEGNDGDLTWETSQELNSDHFDIERSLDNGSTYEHIGNVKAAGNSTTAKSYEFIDPNVKAIAKDKIFYRLKMVDIDNTYKYSNTVVLKLNDAGNSIYANVYPNPATETLFVDYQLYGVKSAEMRFVNTLGQTIYILDLKGNSQMQTAQFDLRDWSVGVYFLQISTESTTITKKFVKE